MSVVCSDRIPPLPDTKARLQSATWAAPALPHDLTGGVADVVHSACQSRLAEAELTAGGVEREVAAEGEVVVGDEFHAYPILSGAQPYSRRRTERTTRIIVEALRHGH